jgi:hypothetical protein
MSEPETVTACFVAYETRTAGESVVSQFDSGGRQPGVHPPAARAIVRPMPKGPKGERRPADVIGNAVHVMRIATGEIEDVKATPDPAKEHMRRGGLKGGKARARKLSSAERSAIAQKAARARWSRS